MIHTLGRHTAYEHRYPDHFSYFKPDLKGMNKHSIRNEAYKTDIDTSFDNTIRYSDYVLNSFIEALKQHAEPSFLLYSAEHGENLISGECNLSVVLKSFNNIVVSLSMNTKYYDDRST